MTQTPAINDRVAALIVRAIANRRRTQKLTEAQQQTKAPVQGFKQFVASRRAPT